MKSAIASGLLLLSAIAVAGDAKSIAMPGWMAGTWERTEGAKWSEEFWTSPRAGIMLGSSRSGRDEKLGFWEQMRIVQEADGKLAFWATAGDQRPVRFGAVRHEKAEVIFENPAHDYPQRIRYWRVGKQLKAQISLIDGSKPSDFSFTIAGRN